MEQRTSSKALMGMGLILIIVLAGFGWLLVKNHQLTEELTALRGEVQSLRNEIGVLKARKNLTSQPITIRSYSDIYERAKNSVVVVYGFKPITVWTLLGPVLTYERVQGSGFVILYNESYYIITNNHVVEKVVNITLVFNDGEAFKAKLIGSDPYSDLAVLWPFVPESKLIPLNVTSSSELKVGDVVLALGNPLGLQGSLTEGVVSQIGRSIRTQTTGGYLIPDIIQFDAPINPGNSGGPLLNSKGEVVGITTAIIGGAQGIGFAIPSDTIIRELPLLIATGKYDLHPWLGIRGIDMNYELARAMGVNVTYGWLVVSVVEGGPASQAGIKGGDREVVVAGNKVIIGGDIIVAVNGTKVRNGDDLTTYLERNTRPGDVVELTVIRDGQPARIEVTLGKRPPPT
jgi:S1-C subfamily serine protease